MAMRPARSGIWSTLKFGAGGHNCASTGQAVCFQWEKREAIRGVVDAGHHGHQHAEVAEIEEADQGAGFRLRDF